MDLCWKCEIMCYNQFRQDHFAKGIVMGSVKE